VKGIQVREEICSGCRACEVACVVHHDGRFGTAAARIRVAKVESEGIDRPNVCHLCQPAPCVEACPGEALTKDTTTGTVLLRADDCTGCGTCVDACPFEAIALHPDSDLPLICDLCGGDPACVKRCATGAIVYDKKRDDIGREPESTHTLRFTHHVSHTTLGYGGTVLRVNLTDGAIHRHATEEHLARAYLGGRGLNVKRLWDELPAHTDGLSPENMLIFGVGPLAGTTFPGGARFNVTAMSPQTGILGDSNAGGFFGPELKFAGYDQVIIHGRAEHPVTLWVRDDVVELRDARDLWGKDVWETTEAIQQELGDARVQVATVGPGAENGVRFAGVFGNLNRPAARTGMGSVMASKNLKAVAVRGTGFFSVADMVRFNDIIARLDDVIYNHPEYEIRCRLGTTKLIKALNSIGGLPTRHFQQGCFEAADAVSGEAIEELYKLKSKACFACTIPCSRFLMIDDPRFPNLRMEGPEYEPLAGFTARVGNPDLVLGLKCIDLANRYGLDAIALSEVIAWAMECHERGLLTPEEAGGLDLTWGNGETILALIHQVARREGFGDLLADGVRQASARLGRGSEEIALHGKGLELFQADVRTIKAYGLGNAVSSRGADHLRSEPWFEFCEDPEEGIRRYGIPETAFRLEVKGKGLVVKHFEEMAAISDATGVCKNTYNNMEVLDWEGTADLLQAATGWDVTGEEVRRVGERIVNLERLFIAREGITRQDDTLPKRFLEEPLSEGGPSTGSVLELEPMLDEYYDARGWDGETGLPTSQRLTELGLDEQ
jgi:aldehyde:ferredoxin oxidoreductase